MTIINFLSKFVGGGQKGSLPRPVAEERDGCPADDRGLVPRQWLFSRAMAAPTVRRPARDRGAANAAEDPLSALSVRFRERGRLSRRAASGFPEPGPLSPGSGPAPRSAIRGLPKDSPILALVLAAAVAAPRTPQRRLKSARTGPRERRRKPGSDPARQDRTPWPTRRCSRQRCQPQLPWS